MRLAILGAIAASALLAASVVGHGAPAQAQAAAPSADWRTVAPENLLVIETAKGRILVELSPQAAPQHVARIRTLAARGFYDGLKFHRVIANFMAQTGDPLGTGLGGSDLPDVPGEFSFRRGAEGFTQVAIPGSAVYGLYGSLPIQTQPDAQMMITADFKVDAHGLFCPGVLGMARAGDPNSANSQFFLMSGRNASLDGGYTAFGRILQGLDVVKTLKTGAAGGDGAVTDPDVMTRVRIASDLPAGQAPVVRVATPQSPAFTTALATLTRDRAARLSICDVEPIVEVQG
ncbi:MAG: peptidylprolyl isomerase [Brevundimonas sp.]|nr:MAG: peptidylprolyl isomerase [Brevundimonas sp.]